jgi:hypothetical protein
MDFEKLSVILGTFSDLVNVLQCSIVRAIGCSHLIYL